MKTIIAGSRSIKDYQLLLDAIEASGFEITEVVSGAAVGVDKMGERWAAEHNIKLTKFKAEWDRWGKRAGYLRNKQMAEYAEACIILWDGASRGTHMMCDLSREHGLKHYSKNLAEK